MAPEQRRLKGSEEKVEEKIEVCVLIFDFGRMIDANRSIPGVNGGALFY